MRVPRRAETDTCVKRADVLNRKGAFPVSLHAVVSVVVSFVVVCRCSGRYLSCRHPVVRTHLAARWIGGLRQIGPLFGVSHSAAHRVIDSLGPLLALAPVRRRPVDQIAIVDGSLIPTRDHRLAARSKNYRYSTNLQVAIDASTRLVIAVGDPQPGTAPTPSSTAPQASTRSSRAGL